MLVVSYLPLSVVNFTGFVVMYFGLVACGLLIAQAVFRTVAVVKVSKLHAKTVKILNIVCIMDAWMDIE